MKKLTLSFVASLFLGGAIMTLGPTETKAQDLGGWSEEEGYFETNMTFLRASSSPSSHTGKREIVTIDSHGNTLARAYGATKWTGVYHYTTARMENRVTGKVITTSGRVWGISSTTARSPLAANIALYIAKTYWGK